MRSIYTHQPTHHTHPHVQPHLPAAHTSDEERVFLATRAIVKTQFVYTNTSHALCGRRKVNGALLDEFVTIVANSAHSLERRRRGKSWSGGEGQ